MSNTDPFLKSRRNRTIAAAAAGAIVFGPTLVACTAFSSQPKEVVVATCSAANAGRQMISSGGVFLGDFYADYGVSIVDQKGKQLRFLTLAKTYAAADPNFGNRTNDGYPQVATQGMDKREHSTGGLADGLQDITWTGEIDAHVKKTVTVGSNGASNPTYDRWNEAFLTSIVCPSADSLLLQPNGSVQQTTS